MEYEIQMEIKHVLEHENGNTTYQNLGDAAKAVLRKVYIYQKRELSQINNLNLQLRN